MGKKAAGCFLASPPCSLPPVFLSMLALCTTPKSDGVNILTTHPQVSQRMWMPLSALTFLLYSWDFKGFHCAENSKMFRNLLLTIRFWFFGATVRFKTIIQSVGIQRILIMYSRHFLTDWEIVFFTFIMLTIHN